MRNNRLFITHHKQVHNCEWCNKEVEAHALFSIIVAYAMPGHSNHPNAGQFQQHESFGCPGEQHFACSHSCAMKLAIACIYHQEEVHPSIEATDDNELAAIKTILESGIHKSNVKLDEKE